TFTMVTSMRFMKPAMNRTASMIHRRGCAGLSAGGAVMTVRLLFDLGSPRGGRSRARDRIACRCRRQAARLSHPMPNPASPWPAPASADGTAPHRLRGRRDTTPPVAWARRGHFAARGAGQDRWRWSADGRDNLFGEEVLDRLLGEARLLQDLDRMLTDARSGSL